MRTLQNSARHAAAPSQANVRISRRLRIFTDAEREKERLDRLEWDERDPDGARSIGVWEGRTKSKVALESAWDAGHVKRLVPAANQSTRSRASLRTCGFCRQSEDTPMVSAAPAAAVPSESPRLRVRALGLGGILDDAVNLLREHFALFFKIVCVTYLPWTFIVVLLGAYLQSSTPQPGDLQAAQDMVWFAVSRVLPMVAVQYGIVSPFAIGAFSHAAAGCYLGRAVTVEQSLRRALRCSLRLIVANALWMTMMFTVPALTLMGMFTLALSGSAPGAGLVFVGGVLVSVVVGVVVGWLFFVILQAIIVEDEGGLHTFLRSMQLTRRAFLPILGLFIVFLAIRIGLGITAVFIPNLYLQAVVNSIYNGMLTAFEIAVTVVAYFACRSRFENYDLLLLAQHVAEEPGREEGVQLFAEAAPDGGVQR